jgi:predicted GNAT family acetyltransferase
MMSDESTIGNFWDAYKEPNVKPRLVCTEKLFELQFPLLVQKCEWNVRTANIEEVEQIAIAHAEVAFLESGTNPLEKDPEGFMKRCLRRIEKERTFVVFEDNKLVFKADIVAETEDVVYLEGVYVSPEYRGQGIAPKCLSKLNLELLERVENICLMSNQKFESAHRSFAKAGFVSNDVCTTIFV